MKKLNKQLMYKYGGEILPFKRLTMPYKLSVATYLGLEGDKWLNLTGAWSDKAFGKLISIIDQYDEKYGEEKFGVTNIPVNFCKHYIMTVIDIDGVTLTDTYGSFEEYHKWYIGHCGEEKHTKKNPWPCFLSEFDDEFFEDGWHRFHRYVDLKMPSIPCVCSML